MKTLHWRTWAWEYGLPTSLLVGSLVVMSIVWDDPAGWWAMVVGPIVAFGSGLIARPPHVWVAPVVVTTLFCVAAFVSAALGTLDYELTTAKWVAATLAVLFIAVALPQTFMIWMGKLLGTMVADIRDYMTS
jgi:hypothetical protein